MTTDVIIEQLNRWHDLDSLIYAPEKFHESVMPLIPDIITILAADKDRILTLSNTLKNGQVELDNLKNLVDRHVSEIRDLKAKIEEQWGEIEKLKRASATAIKALQNIFV